MSSNLHGKRVLVLEDNFLVAIEIADALEAANAIVVGPCSDLADAEMQVPNSDLAVLDVDIRGRTSFALADRLMGLDVPYVFFTGYDRTLLPERFAGIDVITKPTSPEVAVKHLEMLSREVQGASIVELVPALRVQARTYLTDPLAADRLVERTLQLAIEDPGPLPAGAALGAWLTRLMIAAVTEGRAQFLN